MSGSGGGLFQRLRARRWKPQWQKSFDSQQEKTFKVNHLLKLACGSRYFTCDYVTLHVSSPALYTFIIHDRHKHINTDPMAPREVLFFFGSWRDLRYFCVCTTSRPPPANCPQHDWMIESVRVKCTSRNGKKKTWATYTSWHDWTLIVRIYSSLAKHAISQCQCCVSALWIRSSPRFNPLLLTHATHFHQFLRK